MMRRNGLAILLVTSIPAATGVFMSSTIADDARRMTNEELGAMLGDPGLIILDVRQEAHWNSSDLKNQGAIRENWKEVKSWAERDPKDKTIVLYVLY